MVNIIQGNKLLRNTSDGKFQKAIDLTGSTVDNLSVGALKTNAIFAADIDNDSLLDIVIGNEDRKNQLLINSGNGNYQNGVINFPNSGTLITYCVFAADLNNDRMLDIVVGSGNGSNQLLINTGDGSII
jgi:hypothetical protein